MKCAKCHYDNPNDAKFCMECGTSLALACAKCGTDLPAAAKFCLECGTPVGGAGIAEARVPRDYTPKHLADKILQSKSVLEGERKHVTVLFADVKGSMDLANRLDPEEWHKVLDRFFEILTDGIHRFEGTINQYTGDGIMALFGAPIAHEDHAQRACYAALYLRDELRRYAEGLRLSSGVDFSVRMGINSGDVVVGKIGDDLRMDYTAQGHTVGIAQRMESLAFAHSVYVSESTAKLVEGFVALKDLGEANVKGADQPVCVFELTGMGEHQTRFDVSRARGLSRFVGRGADMRVLEEALEQAKSGNGQVVGVVAEAGTGKSRLCFEFAEQCRANGIQVLRGSGVAHGKNIPLLPIMQIFRAYFGISEQDDDRTVREKIAGRLLLMEESLRDALPLLFEFMGAPDPNNPAPSMDPDARQRQLFGIMRRITQARAEQEAGTIVTLIEDLHWIDGASEAWVEQLVEAVAGSRTFLLVNFRPEYHGGWMQKSYYRQLPLLPLGRDAIQDLLSDVLGTDPSINGLADMIHQRTAGNPFFTEEVVQALIESGNLEGAKGNYRLTTPIDRLTVPTTVQSVLSARIDRLRDNEKEVLQTASVIGKEFPESILRVIIELDADEVSVSLQTLKDSEFIYQQSLYPVSEYAFKHPLTQEVALSSQLRERRKTVHAAVARALEQNPPEKLDEMAALIAHHHEEAAELAKAATWHLRAAEWLNANDPMQSRTHWRKVYALAKALPATREAMEHTLKASHNLLAGVFRFGIDDEERDRLAAEGKALAERLGDKHGEFGIELSFAACHNHAGYIIDGFESAKRAVALADEIGDIELRVYAKCILLDNYGSRGDFESARRQADVILAIAGKDDTIGMEQYRVPIPVWAYGQVGLAQMYLGERDQSVHHIEACLRRMLELNVPECAVFCYQHLTEECMITGGRDQVVQYGQRALELAEISGSPVALIAAHKALGQAYVIVGEAEAAVEPLERAVRDSRERRVGHGFLGSMLAILSRAYSDTGAYDLARQAAEEGIQFSERAGSPFQEEMALLALSQALRGLDVEAHRDRINAALDRADACVQETKTLGVLPFVTEERARVADALCDAQSATDYLLQSLEQFSRNHATGHVERLTAELSDKSRV